MGEAKILLFALLKDSITMPALLDFDDVISNLTKGQSETISKIDSEVLISSLTLNPLFGLDSQSVSAARDIVAKHLRRAFTKESRLGINRSDSGDDTDGDQKILLTCQKSSKETLNFPRLKEIPLNRRVLNNNVSTLKKSVSSINDSLEDESCLEGNPLAVKFASLDLPSELLDCSETFEGQGGVLEDEVDWIVGLPVKKARKIASEFALDQASKPASTPLWIACDGKDDASTAFLSVLPAGDGSTNITDVSFRSITTIEAHDPIELLLTDASQCDAHNYAQLSAFYILWLTSTDEEEEDVKLEFEVSDKNEYVKRIMVLEVDWAWNSLAEKHLQQAPAVTDKMLDCRLHLTIGGCPSQRNTMAKLNVCQSRLLKMYEDMRKLEAFLRGLFKGELTWFPDDNERGMVHRVTDLMRNERPSESHLVEVKSERSESTSDEPLMIEEDRLDFVAKLWNLLRGCSSVNELQDALARVSLTIVNASSVDRLPSKLANSNTSNVAKLVLTSLERLLNTEEVGVEDNQRTDNPFIGLNPLLLLAELGVDKLKQEFRQFATELIPNLPLDKLIKGGSNVSKKKYLDPKDVCLAEFHQLVLSHYLVDSLVQVDTFFKSLSLEEAALKVSGLLRSHPPKNMADYKTLTLKIGLSDVGEEQLKRPTSWMARVPMGEEEESTLTVHVSDLKGVANKLEQDNCENRLYLSIINSISHE